MNKRVDFPRGHAENPMTDDELRAKFDLVASAAGLSGATASDVCEAVLAVPGENSLERLNQALDRASSELVSNHSEGVAALCP